MNYCFQELYPRFYSLQEIPASSIQLGNCEPLDEFTLVSWNRSCVLIIDLTDLKTSKIVGICKWVDCGNCDELCGAGVRRSLFTGQSWWYCPVHNEVLICRDISCITDVCVNGGEILILGDSDRRRLYSISHSPYAVQSPGHYCLYTPKYLPLRGLACVPQSWCRLYRQISPHQWIEAATAWNPWQKIECCSEMNEMWNKS